MKLIKAKGEGYIPIALENAKISNKGTIPFAFQSETRRSRFFKAEFTLGVNEHLKNRDQHKIDTDVTILNSSRERASPKGEQQDVASKSRSLKGEGYKAVKLISVALKFDAAKSIPVGRLAIKNNRIYFEYFPIFLKTNLLISPFKLPPKPGVQAFDNELFDGLSGVFNDSLPDGWGRLLLDRALRAHGISPAQLTPLDRLAQVGLCGMGALVYEPHYKLTTTENVSLNLDFLAKHAREILEGAADDVLDELLMLNGSSAGARPKALIGVNEKRNSIISGVDDLSNNCIPKAFQVALMRARSRAAECMNKYMSSETSAQQSRSLKGEGYSHWIVKFSNSSENIDSGAIEYVYAQMAKNAGVTMEDIHLFPAKKSPGYFASKRFDRVGNNRLHLLSACGLLHSDFRTPSLDYDDLIKATMLLTKDLREAEKMFRLAVFNVLAHNRDDHAKNISFLMDENGVWKVAPAYDLIFSFGPGGEQSAMVMGEGKNPNAEHLLALGRAAGFSRAKIKSIIEQTRAALSEWPRLAKRVHVSKAKIKEIKKAICN